jgi:hypothetical protein
LLPSSWTLLIFDHKLTSQVETGQLHSGPTMSAANLAYHVPPPHGVPDHVIDNLLGRGLNAAEWQAALEANNYSWKPILRNTFKRRELWFFKSEIEGLLKQPSFYNTTGRKSNSCRSILMYIQGHSGDRQQRLETRRLCGPEIA